MYHSKVLLPAKRVIAKRRYTRATKVHLEGVSVHHIPCTHYMCTHTLSTRANAHSIRYVQCPK